MAHGTTTKSCILQIWKNCNVSSQNMKPVFFQKKFTVKTRILLLSKWLIPSSKQDSTLKQTLNIWRPNDQDRINSRIHKENKAIPESITIHFPPSCPTTLGSKILFAPRCFCLTCSFEPKNVSKSLLFSYGLLNRLKWQAKPQTSISALEKSRSSRASTQSILRKTAVSIWTIKFNSFAYFQ